MAYISGSCLSIVQTPLHSKVKHGEALPDAQLTAKCKIKNDKEILVINNITINSGINNITINSG